MNTIPVLIDILKDVPHIDFDPSLAWEGNRLVDIALSWTCSYDCTASRLGITRPARLHRGFFPASARQLPPAVLPVYRRCGPGILSNDRGEDPVFWLYVNQAFLTRVLMPFDFTSIAAEILSQFAPAFHGFYRALISTTFRWKPQHWAQLSKNLNPLFDQHSIEALNRLVTDVVQLEETDPEAMQFVTTLLARYVSRGRPLSGYFLICCVIEVQWTVLTQALIPLNPNAEGVQFSEAAAANHAWASLLRSPVSTVAKTDKDFAAALEASKELSMECFTDLLVQIDEMDTAPSQDSYASETMSESLVKFSNRPPHDEFSSPCRRNFPLSVLRP